MTLAVVASSFISAVAAATGMALFRYGGRDKTQIVELVNIGVFSGCVLLVIAVFLVVQSPS
jgi:hypothetical protein